MSIRNGPPPSSHLPFFDAQYHLKPKALYSSSKLTSIVAIMQFYAVALCFFVALIPHNVAKSTVQLPPGPLPLPNNSTGAAVVTSTGFTRVYYLAADNSIHELRGTGIPRPGVTYLDSLRVAASKVGTDSPLAAVELNREIEDVRTQLSIPFDCNTNIFCVDQALLHRPRRLSQGVPHTRFIGWCPQQRESASQAR